MAPAKALPQEWRDRFQKTPLARDVVASLAGRSAEIWRKTFDLLRKDSPEYRNAVDDEFTEESRSHCKQLLDTIVALAAGRVRVSDPFDFVRRHAEWRARHQVPLVASLHAYRLAHKTYWAITRESLEEHRRRQQAMHGLSMLSDFWMEFFDHVSSVLEEAHMAEEASVINQNSAAYAALIDDLLRGIEPADPESRRLCTLCGIRPGMHLAITLIHPLSPHREAPTDVEVTLRSLARLIHQKLPASAFGKLVTVRSAEIVVLVSSESETSERLARVLKQSVLGRRSGVSAGISLDKTEIPRLPEAVTEARIALDLASARRPLVRFADIDLNEYLILRADPAALRLIPNWAREWHAAANGQGDPLSHTIRIFAECSLNVKQTASRLGVHTNTVYFRLNQIKKRTGVNPRTFAGTSLLLTAFRLLEQNTPSGGRA